MNLPANVIAAGRAAVQAQWSDTAIVTRKQKIGNVKKDVEIYSGITCHLSQASKPALEQSDTVATTAAVFTVFVDTEVQLQPGDTLIISHKGQTFTGAVGEPFNGTFSNSVRLEAVKIT
ncbi:hypothetical protein [Faecalispora jeddahensis]|uniref:hypothetical protein n=1 Tax=Faecalispora jeddahensis TaxID=1414721 RepID=UPI0004AF49ED|nr:hypothetical protein [Faecalispora jeddahensis]